MSGISRAVLVSSSTQISDGVVTTAKLADQAVTNAKVNNAAAIAYSKLNLVDAIVNADINTAAAILASKIADLGLQLLNDEEMGSDADTFASGTFTATEILVIYLSIRLKNTNGAGFAPHLQIQFNGDTGANYASKQRQDATTTDNASAAFILVADTTAINDTEIRKYDLVMVITDNVAARRKYCSIFGVNKDDENTSVATTPNNLKVTGDWANVLAQIVSLQFTHNGVAGDVEFMTGSKVAVYGRNVT